VSSCALVLNHNRHSMFQPALSHQFARALMRSHRAAPAKGMFVPRAHQQTGMCGQMTWNDLACAAECIQGSGKIACMQSTHAVKNRMHAIEV